MIPLKATQLEVFYANLNKKTVKVMIEEPDGSCSQLNPFHSSVPFLFPLKTPKPHLFLDVFRVYQNGKLA